jgi:hypothetical protein
LQKKHDLRLNGFPDVPARLGRDPVPPTIFGFGFFAAIE